MIEPWVNMRTHQRQTEASRTSRPHIICNNNPVKLVCQRLTTLQSACVSEPRCDIRLLNIRESQERLNEDFDSNLLVKKGLLVFRITTNLNIFTVTAQKLGIKKKYCIIILWKNVLNVHDLMSFVVDFLSRRWINNDSHLLLLQPQNSHSANVKLL